MVRVAYYNVIVDKRDSYRSKKEWERFKMTKKYYASELDEMTGSNMVASHYLNDDVFSLFDKEDEGGRYTDNKKDFDWAAELLQAIIYLDDHDSDEINDDNNSYDDLIVAAEELRISNGEFNTVEELETFLENYDRSYDITRFDYMTRNDMADLKRAYDKGEAYVSEADKEPYKFIVEETGVDGVVKVR